MEGSYFGLSSGWTWLESGQSGKREDLAIVALAFWGLWLFPFGFLVIKSGYFPRVRGVLLLVAGFAYMVNSMATLVLPDHRQLLSRIMMPLYFGEVPIIFWLLIKGLRAKQTDAQAG